MSQPARDKFKPVSVQQARIADVNAGDFTVTVMTEDSYKRWFDIPFNVPYLHAPTGSGIHFLPEPGAVCWVAQPADYGPMFVLGWFSPPSLDQSGGSRGFRRALEPGDMIMDGRDGNYVWVRRGGIVEVAATPIARRFYIPVNNLIRDLCESYRMQTFGGAWEWSVARSADDKDGRAPINFALGVKEFSDDDKVMVSLEMSNSVDGDPANLLNAGGVVPSEDNTSDRPAIKFRIYNPADGFAEVVTYVFGKDGNVDVTFEGAFSLTVAEQIALTSRGGDIVVTTEDGSITHRSSADMLLEAKDGKLTIDVGSLLISTKDGAKVSGGSVEFKTDVKVTAGSQQVDSVLLKAFSDWVMTWAHTHTEAGPPITPLTLAGKVPPVVPLLPNTYSAVLKAKPAP